jgi:hypothetical protein
VIPIAAGILAAAMAAFALSLAQARINARHGTDHAVHTFLINRLRERNGRLFVRIPNLLNEAYIGALPLYLHWIFAKFPLRFMRAAEVALNPAVNFVHTIVAGILGLLLAREIGAPPAFAVAMSLLFGITPQFYHALSARNFGLSARSLGLVLLTACFFLSFRAAQDPGDFVAWALLAAACFLVFAFSTFGLQALVLIGCGMLVLGHPQLIAGTALGLVLFLAAHPRYSLGYLTNTARFILAYSRDLAPRYVLARRYSIWRDLVRDIWVKLRQDGVTAGLRYAYENSILLVVVLSPLTVVAAACAIAGGRWLSGAFAAYSADVAAAALAAMLLTSFRATRFLGEPERYVEAGAAFATLAAGAVIWQWGGLKLLWLIVALSAVLCVLQIWASLLLSRYLSFKPLALDGARDAIQASSGGEVRCASNNEQYIKLMLPNDWQFSYCIAVGHGYCGMTIGEVFDPFPYPRREALQKIVATYRINYCLLDRSRFEDLFDTPPADLVQQSTIFESAGVRVVRLDWSGETPATVS